MDHLRYLCLVFVILSRLFIAALWSPAGKGLTSWLLSVIFYFFFVTFPCGILGQVWYLIVSFPDFSAFLTLVGSIIYTAIIQVRAIIGPPANRHCYGVSLVGRKLPAFTCLLGPLLNLINLNI